MNKKSIISAVLLGTFFMTFSSGCSITDLSADSPLTPPKTIGDEAEIEKLISANANKNYTLKYPKNGNFRSAIIMTDLDNDKVDETIVFYRENEDTTKLHMLVMYSSKDKWNISSDTVCETTDIDSVDFADVTGNGSLEILVGYSTFTPNVNFLTCYTYSKGRTEEITSGQKYSSFYCSDFNSDGKQEIMTLSLFTTENEANATMLEYNKSKNNLYSKAVVAMDPNVVRYKNITTTEIGENTKAIIIDGEYATTDLSTQLIYYNKELLLLRNPLVGDKNTNITKRSGLVISTDIDNDETVEIPTVSKLPFSTKDSSLVADLIGWGAFSAQNETVTTKQNMIANYTFEYAIKMHSNWNPNSVTAINSLKDNSMTVYEWNGKSLGEQLFEVKVFATNDWDKGKNIDNYTLIYKDNRYAYAFINANAKSKLSISDDEIKKAFVILSDATA